MVPRFVPDRQAAETLSEVVVPSGEQGLSVPVLMQTSAEDNAMTKVLVQLKRQTPPR